MRLLAPYVTALRHEPKLRTYALASFVDDLGIATSAWAQTLMMTNLFTTQRARASLVVPSLVCFLLGTIVSGPLADWASRRSLAHLARFRWRLMVWARLLQAAVLGVLVVALSVGAPSIGRVLPFAMLFAFTKTAFRPTRIAFAVDLLKHETPQTDASGATLRDERGNVLLYKTHLLAQTSLIEALAAAAVLGGLLVGGRVLAMASGRFWPLFAIQGLMHVGYCAVVFFGCHPTRSARQVGVRELVVDVPEPGEADPPPPGRATLLAPLRHFGASIAEGVRFLARREQRALLLLLFGVALVEFVTESYDGKMIVKHVLHGSDEALRYAEIFWGVVAVLGVAAVPALSRAVGGLGRLFLVTMLTDGLVIVLGGQIARAEAPSAVMPFVLVIGLDHALTLASTSLVELAQNSASSAAMRGRIAGTYALFVIVGDMVVEGIATSLSEAVGIPAMLVRVGIAQVAIVMVLFAVGRGKLWRFGLRGAMEPA